MTAGDPPVSAPDYGRSLRGLGFNLLVSDVPRAVKFAEAVLAPHPSLPMTASPP